MRLSHFKASKYFQDNDIVGFNLEQNPYVIYGYERGTSIVALQKHKNNSELYLSILRLDSILQSRLRILRYSFNLENKTNLNGPNILRINKENEGTAYYPEHYEHFFDIDLKKIIEFKEYLFFDELYTLIEKDQKTDLKMQ